MTGLLIAICFGWMGGYRFYKKQTGMGVLYLFTGGLAGIGWIYDIYTAFKATQRPKAVYVLPKSIKAKVMGAFASCQKDESRKRVEIIANLNVGDKLALEHALYNGAKFFLVIDTYSGLDIGALPHDLSRGLIMNGYTPDKCDVTLTKCDLDYPEITINIK